MLIRRLVGDGGASAVGVGFELPGQIRPRGGVSAGAGWLLRPVGPRAYALPASEGLREAGHLDVAEPLGDLGDGEATGDEELLGQLLADLVEQRPERDTLTGEPAPQRAVAHVQRRRDALQIRRRGG